MPRFNLPDVDFIQTDATKLEERLLKLFEEQTGRSLAQGDPIRLFILTVANAFAQFSNAFNAGARQNLLSYATGEYLDHLGAFVNTKRLEATGAKTVLKFTLSAAQSGVYVIPKGTKVTNGKIIFATDVYAEIPIGELEVSVRATATTAGAAGNGILPGNICQMVDVLPSISKVENTEVSSGGTDIEDDEAYAYRIQLAPASFSVAGPTDAYIYHALSFNGSIIDVSVYGKEDRPGDVYIHALLDGGVIPEQGFMDELKAYLSADDIRPLTDLIVATPPQAIDYNINLTWYLSIDDVSRVEQITQAVTQAVEDYRLWQQSKIGRDINPDVLTEYLRKAGVKRLVITEPIFTIVENNQVAQCLASENVIVNYGGSEAG